MSSSFKSTNRLAVQVDEFIPFQYERDMIGCIVNQQNSLTLLFKYFKETIPKNNRSSKDYGDKLIQSSDKLRLIIKDVSIYQDLGEQLQQFFTFYTMLGMMHQANFKELPEEETQQFMGPLGTVVQDTKRQNCLQDVQKNLAKVQQAYSAVDKAKSDFQKYAAEAQDLLQKYKISKDNPETKYNMSLLDQMKEKAQRGIKSMEERQMQYKMAFRSFDPVNQDFQRSFEQLIQSHQSLVQDGCVSLKLGMYTFVEQERNHFESLKEVLPEKTAVIRKQVLQVEQLLAEWKQAQEKNNKMSMVMAKQKILDLNGQAITYQAMQPYAGTINDSQEFFNRISDQQIKIQQGLCAFFVELLSSQKYLQKNLSNYNAAFKKNKESLQISANLPQQSLKHSNSFAQMVVEVGKVLDAKERHYLGFSKFTEQHSHKVESIAKQFKADEKAFSGAVGRAVKEIGSQNEKVTKLLVSLTKQSEQLSAQIGNPDQNPKFSGLLAEYKGVNDQMRDVNSAYKSFLLTQFDGAMEAMKAFKDQVILNIKNVQQIIVALVNFEEQFTHQMIQLLQDQSKFQQGFAPDQILQEFLAMKALYANQQQEEELKMLSEKSSVESEHKSNQDEAEREEEEIELNKDIEEEDLQDRIGHNQRGSGKIQSQKTSPSRKKSPQPLSRENSLRVTDQRKESHDHALSPNLSRKTISKEDSADSHGQRNYSSNPSNPSNPYNQKPNSGDPVKSFFKGMKNKITNQLNLNDVPKEMQKDVDQIKKAAQNQEPVVESQGVADTPNAKFILEKFNVLAEGEKVVETYSCALSLKIILQGRLYVTNKNLFFHSYFNDKTIFGKETKYLVPFKNIQQIEKKYNAVVFDNSISVVTKDKKGIFFTSFVYRDQAFNMIQGLLDQFRNDESGQTLSQSADSEKESTPKTLENRSNRSCGSEALNNLTTALANSLALEEVKEDPTNEHLRSSIPLEEGSAQEESPVFEEAKDEPKIESQLESKQEAQLEPKKSPYLQGKQEEAETQPKEELKEEAKQETEVRQEPTPETKPVAKPEVKKEIEVKDIQEENKATDKVVEQEKESSFNEEDVLKTYNRVDWVLNEEFKAVERERLSKVKQKIKDFDNFPWVIFEENLEHDLRYVVQMFLNNGRKLPSLKNLSLIEYISINVQHNKDLKTNRAVKLPSYFSNPDMAAPTPQEFRKWSLEPESFTVKLTHVPPNPKFMQPKQNDSEETNELYFLSPRVVLRRTIIASFGFQYADCFTLESLSTFTQEANGKTSFKLAFRINLIKPIRLIQGMVVKETEKSLRANYEGTFFQEINRLLGELQGYSKKAFVDQKRALFEKEKATEKKEVNQGQVEVQVKEDQKEKAEQQEVVEKQEVNEQVVEEEKEFQQVQELSPLKGMASEEVVEKLDRIQKEVSELQQKVGSLEMYILVLLGINAFLLLVTLFWK